MKKIIMILVIFLLSTPIFAQVDNQNGSQHLRIGANSLGNNTNLKVIYNHGLSEMFSIGAGAYILNDSHGFIRGDFYLDAIVPLPEKMNIYGGIELGVIGIDFLHFDPQIGIAYSLTNFIDLFLEVGGSGTLGVSFKF